MEAFCYTVFMNSTSYETVVADIDGTLVQYRPDLSTLAEADTFISQSTIEAINKMHRLGLNVAAVTGRPYEESRELVISLGITGPCVFSDGASIRKVPDGELLFEAAMEPEISNSVITMLKDTLGSTQRMNLTPSEKSLGKITSIWSVVDKGDVTVLLEKLSDIEGIFYVVNEGAGLDTQSGLKVLSEQANKGLAVKRLLSMLGSEAYKTACVGDGANDVTMFKECGLSIAMGNGEQVLKQVADHIVSDIDKDGFAEAVEYILSAKSSKFFQ
jgi:hydroxymethylpyrimidine pyrophosphatase-like HAD family hydrolase